MPALNIQRQLLHVLAHARTPSLHTQCWSSIGSVRRCSSRDSDGARNVAACRAAVAATVTVAGVALAGTRAAPDHARSGSVGVCSSFTRALHTVPVASQRQICYNSSCVRVCHRLTVRQCTAVNEAGVVRLQWSRITTLALGAAARPTPSAANSPLGLRKFGVRTRSLRV